MTPKIMQRKITKYDRKIFTKLYNNVHKTTKKIPSNQTTEKEGCGLSRVILKNGAVGRGIDGVESKTAATRCRGHSGMCGPTVPLVVC